MSCEVEIPAEGFPALATRVGLVSHTILLWTGSKIPDEGFSTLAALIKLLPRGAGQDIL